MRDPIELNISQAVGEPPSETLVELFEDRFQVKLPVEFVKLLHYSNGGYPELDSFIPKAAASQHFRGVDRFYGLTADREHVSKLWGATAAWQSSAGKQIVPIAHTAGGDQIVLLYESTPPSVWLCLHDEGFKMTLVADSFSEFIDMLCEDPEMI